MNQDKTLTFVQACVVAFIAAIGTGIVMLTFAPDPVVQNITTAGTSPQGSTFTSAKFAGVAARLSSPGASATSSSLLNSDSNDRIITGLRVGCQSVGTSQTAYTGAGLASLTVFAATTSSSAPATNSNTNKVGGGNITIGTSTATYTIATSSAPTGTGAIYNVWATGTYLTFTVNATNTALCTFGADYIGT